jgi:hypothetical protein
LCILWNCKGGKIWRWGWSLQCSFFKHAKCPLLHPRTKLWSLKSFKLRWILIYHLTFQLSLIKFVYVCNCVFSSCGCLWIPHKLSIHLFYMVVWKLYLQGLIYKILTYGMFLCIAIFKDWTIVLLSLTSFVIQFCPLFLPIFSSFSKY